VKHKAIGAGRGCQETGRGSAAWAGPGETAVGRCASVHRPGGEGRGTMPWGRRCVPALRERGRGAQP
jgi:hypothetical protein